MSLIKAPTELQLEGNLSDNWKKFKRDFTNFLIASEKDTKSDAIKIAILQSYGGEPGLKLLESFNLSAENAAKYDSVLNKYEEFCNPRKNIVMERVKFLKTQQREGESFNEFLTTLKN